MGMRVLALSCLTNMAGGRLRAAPRPRGRPRGGRAAPVDAPRRAHPRRRRRPRRSHEPAPRRHAVPLRRSSTEMARLAAEARDARPRALLGLPGGRRPQDPHRRDRHRLQHRERLLRPDHVRGAGGGLQGGVRGPRRASTPIAVVADADRLTPPCGPCRQILWELCGNLTVHMVNLKGRSRTLRLQDLLPLPFDEREPVTDRTRGRGLRRPGPGEDPASIRGLRGPQPGAGRSRPTGQRKESGPERRPRGA